MIFWTIGLKLTHHVKVVQIVWEGALHSTAIAQSVCRLEDFKVVSERKPSAQSIRPNGRFS